MANIFSPKLYQIFVGLFAALGAFLFGYDLGVIAAVVASQSFIDKFQPRDTTSGLVVSIFTAGAFFGAGAAGPLGDRLGRRATISIGAVVFLLGDGLQTGGQSIHYLWGGRLVSDLGVGTLCMIVPLYQAELAHPGIRVLNGASPLAIQNVPAIFLAALTYLFLESPRWLLNKGRNDEALKTLAKLHANNDVNDTFVRAEFDLMKTTIEIEHQQEARSYAELFKSRSAFRRLFLCSAIQASVQLTGVSAIQHFSLTIFAKIGVSSEDTMKYQGISNGLAIVAQTCTMLLIDRTVRRWPLVGGNIFNSITFIVSSILLAKFPPGMSTNRGVQWGFIAVTWLYNFSFSATCGPLSWIIPSEVFDTKTRSKGVSIATMTSFAFNTMIGQVTPIAMEDIGYRFYFLFVACNITNALFFWLFLPETARLPLEEMNELFSSDTWVVAGKQTRIRSGNYEDDLKA